MKTQILDRGYVELIESWGSDERIIESARMSTGKGFLGWGPKCSRCGAALPDDPLTAGPCPDPAPGVPFVDCGVQGHVFDAPGDEKLLRYLWDHAHATPFEMAGFTVEVKAPIMVFREWHRHRTQSFNEMSARYVPLPDENYMPWAQVVLERSKATHNKQASGSGRVPSEAEVTSWLRDLGDAYARAEQVYRAGLELGVPKELARLPVPVGRYSAMRASANLRNWLSFLKLRCDPAAQWEIRQYANAVAEVVREKFPRTFDVAKASLGLESS